MPQFSGRFVLPQNCAIPPPWYLVSHRHICVIPHFETYHAIMFARFYKKEAPNGFGILSLRALQDMESIAVGPLRAPPKYIWITQSSMLQTIHLTVGAQRGDKIANMIFRSLWTLKSTFWKSQARLLPEWVPGDKFFLQSWMLWSFRWQLLCLFLLGETDRNFVTKDPPHPSPPKIQNFITKNFWDCFRIRDPRLHRLVADVWYKDVWDFQAFSQIFFELRFP